MTDDQLRRKFHLLVDPVFGQDRAASIVEAVDEIEKLPSVLETPLSEPLFILGTLFVLLVFFVPGGLAGLGRRLRQVRV